MVIIFFHVKQLHVMLSYTGVEIMNNSHVKQCRKLSLLFGQNMKLEYISSMLKVNVCYYTSHNKESILLVKR